MKIALYHSLPPGGALKVFAEFARRLGQSHFVDVYCLAIPGERNEQSVFENVKTVNVTEFSMSFGSPNLIKNPVPFLDYYRLHRVSKKIAREIDSKKYDVVILFACRFMQSPLPAKYLMSPTVYYCTEPWRFFLDPRFLSDRAIPLKKQLGFLALTPWYAFIKRAERKIPSYADIVFTHSLFTQNLINRIYTISSKLCYLGIDTEFFQPEIRNKKENIVLSVGAVIWKKGHEDAIRALGKIDREIRPKLIIAGHWSDKTEPGRLAEIAGDLKVDTELLIGTVKDRELVALYNKAKIVLCLSYSEPFGLTALESMACCTPVIAVREGGFIETVGNGKTGFLVERNSEAISSKIKLLLRDEALQATMGKAGREEVLHSWTWDRTISLISEFAKTAIENKNRS